MGEGQAEILAVNWRSGGFAFQAVSEFPGHLKRKVLEGSVVEEEQRSEAYQKSYSTGYKLVSNFWEKGSGVFEKLTQRFSRDSKHLGRAFELRLLLVAATVAAAAALVARPS